MSINGMYQVKTNVGYSWLLVFVLDNYYNLLFLQLQDNHFFLYKNHKGLVQTIPLTETRESEGPVPDGLLSKIIANRPYDFGSNSFAFM